MNFVQRTTSTFLIEMKRNFTHVIAMMSRCAWHNFFCFISVSTELLPLVNFYNWILCSELLHFWWEWNETSHMWTLWWVHVHDIVFFRVISVSTELLPLVNFWPLNFVQRTTSTFLIGMKWNFTHVITMMSRCAWHNFFASFQSLQSYFPLVIF